MKQSTISAPPALSITPGKYRKVLENIFQNSFVVSPFEYQGLILDYAIIVTDRLIEVCHVTSKAALAKELATVGRAGKISYNKHKSIQDGKFISNAFYFLAPSRVLTSDEIPPKYGLITYTTGDVVEIKTEANWINPVEYLKSAFYKTLAKKLATQLYR